MLIREEQPQDYYQVENLVRQSFWNLFQKGADQHFIVHKIRKTSQFIKELTLVVEDNKKIIAHILYFKSKVVYQNGTNLQTITFGPLSVHPQKQSLGIGKMLVNHSLQKAKQMGFKGVIIQGHPNYYPRFGFQTSKTYNIKDCDGEFYLGTMVLQLQKDYFLKNIEGTLFLPEVFENLYDTEIEAFDLNFVQKQKFKTRSQQVFEILVVKKWNEECLIDPKDVYNRQKIEQ